MGWWGCGIMEGDAPSDLFYDIRVRLLGKEAMASSDKAETEKEFEAAETKLDEQFNAEMCKAKVVNGLFAAAGAGEFDTSLSEYETRLVIGFLVMSIGGPLNKKNRAKVLTAARRDGWAANDTERKQIMDKFIAIVEAYDGTPTEIPSASLLEKLSEVVGKAEDSPTISLINVYPNGIPKVQ